MNYTQKSKIAQVTEKTLVVGLDIGSETNFARAFNWWGRNCPRRCFASATAWKAFKASWSIWKDSRPSHLPSRSLWAVNPPGTTASI